MAPSPPWLVAGRAAAALHAMDDVVDLDNFIAVEASPARCTPWTSTASRTSAGWSFAGPREARS